ncbi:MAG: hypothetical protein AAGF20_07645 [Pseudomonadota bacterium]
MPNGSARKRRRRIKLRLKQSPAIDQAAIERAETLTIITEDRLAKGDIVVTDLPVVGKVPHVQSPWAIDRLRQSGALTPAQHETATRLKALRDEAYGEARVTAGYQPRVASGWRDSLTIGDEEAERKLRATQRHIGMVGSGVVARVVFDDREPEGFDDLTNLRLALDAIDRHWSGGRQSAAFERPRMVAWRAAG